MKAALERGQVDRLLVPATPSKTVAEKSTADAEMTGPKEQRSELDEATIEELVTLARRTDAEMKSQESNRLKDEFLATVSQELRTPLNAMLGWLQIIRTTDRDRATLERAMASIERNAQSQARVVEDLIELSRVVTGKLHLRTQPIDLRAVVESALDVVRLVSSKPSALSPLSWRAFAPKS